jgi:hypothetical protein
MSLLFILLSHILKKFSNCETFKTTSLTMMNVGMLFVIFSLGFIMMCEASRDKYSCLDAYAKCGEIASDGFQTNNVNKLIECAGAEIMCDCFQDLETVGPWVSKVCEIDIQSKAAAAGQKEAVGNTSSCCCFNACVGFCAGGTCIGICS